MVTQDKKKVEKQMSITRDEFYRSLASLRPGLAISDGQTRFVFEVGGGEVEIGFAELPSRTLGGLLALPAAKVMLTFSGLDGEERRAFLERFDKAFQRGGG